MRIFAVLLLLVISSVSNAGPVDTNPTVPSSDLLHKEKADKEAKLKDTGRIVKELAIHQHSIKNKLVRGARGVYLKLSILFPQAPTS